MVKLEHYAKNKSIKNRHAALIKEIEIHGIGEVIYTLRQMYVEDDHHRQVLNNDRKWLYAKHIADNTEE
jgi:hypothetical protein